MSDVTREEHENLCKRVKDLETDSTNTRIWQATYGERIDSMYKILEDLSKKPAKRWDALVTTAMNWAVVAFLAYLAFGK